MLVEMDKGMLASLVRGMDPAYEIMDDPLIKPKGYYSGGHSDRWNWNYGLEADYTEENLWATYQLLKNPRPKKTVLGNGILEHVLVHLELVPGVQHAEVTDHFYGVVEICVSGGSDEDVAIALSKALPVSCTTVGDYKISCCDEHGFVSEYFINRKQEIHRK